MVVVVAVVIVIVVVYLSISLLARLKTKLFCQTCSIFEVESDKNAATLATFQKGSISARRLQFFKLTS